ncbi:helix-turn-helix domain-containing protein [Nocardia nova]|uniref:helix-turn-helix domain-containing protein n=1 Tax=Nocardia nova TaxID=37330 RepID=UPI00273A119D|nr:helix-turn-helix domain-containing protein [Nocardia nova]
MGTMTLLKSRKALAQRLTREELRFHTDLVDARVKAGMTTSDVAKRLGIRVEQVEAFERIDSNPTLSEIRYYLLAVGNWVEFNLRSGKRL